LLYYFHLDRKWKQIGITVAGGNGEGNKLNQLYYPHGICIDDNTIYIADWLNHRIVEWESNANVGRVVAGGNGQGHQMNQLNYPKDVIIDKENNSLIIADGGNRRVMRWPRQNNTHGEIIIPDIDCGGLAMDKNGSLYASDSKKNEVQRWKKGDKEGTIVAGGNGKGHDLNQLNNPAFIFVDEEYSLYVSDMDNNRVTKWLKDAKEGIVVAGGNGPKNSLTQLSSPQGVTVDQLGQIYVADSHNNRVMSWCTESIEGTIVVGGNGRGQQLNQLNYPRGLSFDQQGNLYVANQWNHRIDKFEID
jgi:sugar lactone lactonase YvrE